MTRKKTVIKQTKSDHEKALDGVASEEIKQHIKLKMKQCGVNAEIVAKQLTKMGRPITTQGLRNKISLGTHQTMWYWDLMKAIEQACES